MTQPIFISGRVLLEDGTPPPEFAVIETVCGGNTHAEGYADTKGYFAIELGRRNGVLQDASESPGNYNGYGGANNSGISGGGFGSGTGIGSGMGSGGSSELRFANCELRAKLAGYRSQMVSLANRRPMDNPEIGVILMHRLSPNEGTIVSMNSLSAPKDARKAFEKGADAMKKRKTDDAMKAYQKAVTLFPDYAAAWYEIGKLQMGLEDKESARKSFDLAAKADPKFVAPLLEIAVLEVQAQNWKGVVETTDLASKLDSFDYPQLFLFNAVANYNLRNIEAAEKSAIQVEKLDTRHQYPKASHLLGVILAQRKDYTAAAEKFRVYLKFAPTASDAATVRSQLDQVEKFTAQSAPKQDQ